MKKLERFLAIILLSVFVLPATVSAATFGVEGVGGTDYPGVSSYHSGGSQQDYTNDMFIDDDGNIYIAGQSSINSNDWLIQKYNGNGELDYDWGSSGTVTHDSGGFDQATGVFVDDDGVYVVGHVQTNGLDMMVRKYNPSTGNLDTSWGISGVFSYNSTGEQFDYGRYILPDDDGGIYVLGQVGYNGGDAFIIKLDADGDVDTEWGTDGSVTHNLSSNSSADGVMIMARDDDGNFYVGASAAITDEGRNILVAKLDTNGALDTDWGTGGIVSYNSGAAQHDDIRHIVLDSGDLYAIGYSDTNSNDGVILRYDTAGILDTDWGDNGVVIYNSSSGRDEFVGGALDEDGDLYVTGTRAGNNGDFLVHKYNTEGDLDTAWADNGIFTWDSGGASVDYGQRLAFDESGRIVVSGTIGTNSFDIGILRLTEDGTLDISFGNTPVGDFPSGYILASAGVLPEDGTIDSVSLYGATTIGTTTFAIYDEDFGLVWEGDEIVSDVSGDWLTVPIASGTPATLDLTSDTYYLAFQLETTDAVPAYTGRAEAYDGFFSPQAYGAFPDPVVDPILSNINWSIYATYTPAPELEAEEESSSGGSSSSHRRSSSSSSNTTPNDAASPVAFVASGSVEELMIQLVALLQQLLEQLIAEQQGE